MQAAQTQAFSGQVYASFGVWGLPTGNEDTGWCTVAECDGGAVEETLQVIRLHRLEPLCYFSHGGRRDRLQSEAEGLLRRQRSCK